MVKHKRESKAAKPSKLERRTDKRTAKSGNAVKAPTTRRRNASSATLSMARAEGLRLFNLSGRPTKEQFIAVYGENGARWTWAQRAASVGLKTAEDAARKFPAALAKISKA